MQLTDYDVEGAPEATDLHLVAAPLSELLTMELDGAAGALELSGDEILLAALGRAVERTIGGGSIDVDVLGYGASLHRVELACASPDVLDADKMLVGVHRALDSLTVRHLIRGVPADPRSQPVSSVLFAGGPTAATQPHLGHVLELRAYRDGDVLALDWWFDARSFEPYTVRELSEQFPLALIELTSEATPPVHATQELALAH
ncbi:polyketide synthase [Mycolicibacterium madagascariense]|uniref:Polyketide synthase n=2 Tax=Mycolicibacterium madagascariense TaxID=212765 RepID=A0A7I7XGX7_9MYCO|nr:polyketide synthase [Mycolicibacterium madagascariense]